jgi:spore coat polysaccharide biosynthesis predicted glycosyltransferase SpsG
MRVGIRCDADPLTGAGHLIRCVALAEELVRRGTEVIFLGVVAGPDWLHGQIPQGARLLPAPTDLVAEAVRLSLDAMVIDSYVTDPRFGGELRRAGIPVLAIVDGDSRGQEADLYLDQNLGADDQEPELPAGSVRLAGAEFVLLRDCARAFRPVRPRLQSPGVPRMLCFFGGTDSAGVAPRMVGLAVRTGVPFAATVIAATPETARALGEIKPSTDQTLTVLPPTGRVPELAATMDLVVIAAGTSIWEMLCLGVPAALVHVVENQRIGYDATVSRGLAAGLNGPDRRDVLRVLLADPDARMRLAERSHGVIDGRGRERVAAALLDRCR